MKPEEQEKLTDITTLFDSLSPTLKQIFVSQIGYGEKERGIIITNVGSLKNKLGGVTIVNTSNASSHIDVLKEEINDCCFCGKTEKAHR